MDLDGYGADEGQIQRASLRVAETVEWVMGMRKAVRQEVEEMTWLGDAAGVFKERMRDWDREAATIENSLRRIAETGGANAKTYAAAREEAERAINQIDMAINTGATGDLYAPTSR